MKRFTGQNGVKFYLPYYHLVTKSDINIALHLWSAKVKEKEC